MKIKTRIWSLPVISACIFALGMASSSYFSTASLKSIEQTGKVDYPVLSQSVTLRADVKSLIDDLQSAVAEGDKKRLDAIDDRVARLRKSIGQLGAIEGYAPVAQRLLKEVDNYYAAGRTAARIMLELENGDPAPAIGTMQSHLAVLTADLDKTVAAAQRQFDARLTSSADSVRAALTASIAIATLVVLVLAGIAHLVVRAIWEQLGGEPEHARSMARAVAQGDLSIAFETDPKHPHSLLSAIAEMRLRLESIVSGIKISADEIRAASRDVATGSADLSQRMEVQALNLGAASVSMRDLTGMVQQNAETARHADQLANDASQVAVKGGTAVQQVVATMTDIDASARKIVDIISVIDGIAFQTNILALNAAVEAARAGEQGRGFAVVASEVRTLAQRSANAAREIKTLINASVDKVQTGSTLVKGAGTTMEEVVSAVQSVTELIGKISSASQEQSTGLERLAGSIAEMDESTQRNAATTEQAATAAQSLEDFAARLTTAVGVFKLSAAMSAPARASTVLLGSTQDRSREG